MSTAAVSKALLAKRREYLGYLSSKFDDFYFTYVLWTAIKYSLHSKRSSDRNPDEASHYAAEYQKRVFLMAPIKELLPTAGGLPRAPPTPPGVSSPEPDPLKQPYLRLVGLLIWGTLNQHPLRSSTCNAQSRLKT